MGSKNTLRVTAPYVTLKVIDPIAGATVLGFYEGAIVENVDDASAEHHIESGLAEKVSKSATPGPVPEEPDKKSDKPPAAK